jgi:hypothetical protein
MVANEVTLNLQQSLLGINFFLTPIDFVSLGEASLPEEFGSLGNVRHLICNAAKFCSSDTYLSLL